LRALAVLGVFASHVGYSRLVGGWIGVGVFFVLSGYLITSILSAEWARTGAVSLRRFYLRRLLRLYPALLLMLALCAFFTPIFGDGGTAAGYLRTAAATGLYYQDFIVGITGSAHGGFVHTWSLAVEEQFYLIWPPVLIFLLRRGRSVFGWALAGTALSWALLALTTQARPGLAPATYALPHTRGGELLLGCAVAVWLNRNPAVLRHPLLTRWAAPAAALGLLALSLIAGQAGLSAWMPLQIAAAALLSAVLIIGLVSDDTGLISRLLSCRPLVWLGGISYGVYLFHLPVMEALAHLPIPWSAQILLAFAITLAIAGLSYRYLEKPLLRLKPRAPERRLIPLP
jgi:peptidoglycan/LPS O-acetylase OafA/YrhL